MKISLLIIIVSSILLCIYPQRDGILHFKRAEKKDSLSLNEKVKVYYNSCLGANKSKSISKDEWNALLYNISPGNYHSTLRPSIDKGYHNLLLCLSDIQNIFVVKNILKANSENKNLSKTDEKRNSTRAVSL